MTNNNQTNPISVEGTAISNTNNNPNNTPIVTKKEKVMVKTTTLYTLGVTDSLSDVGLEEALLEILGDNNIVNVVDVVELADQLNAKQKSDEVIEGKLLCMDLVLRMNANPNSFLVVGNEWNETDLGLKISHIKDLLVNSFPKRVLAESYLGFLALMKREKPVLNTIDDIEEWLVVNHGFDAIRDEEDENLLIVRFKYGSDITIWFDGVNIRWNGKDIKESLMIFANDMGYHPVSQHTIGIKPKTEVFAMMLAALGVACGHQPEDIAIGVTKGFSGILGPEEYQLRELDAEGYVLNMDNKLGTAVMRMRDDGYVYAGNIGSSNADISVVEAVRDLRKAKDGFWYTTNQMGDEVYKFSEESLIDGTNPLGIKLKVNKADWRLSEITFPGKNIKGLLKSTYVEHGATVKMMFAISSKSPQTNGGQALVSKKKAKEIFITTRRMVFGGKVQYSMHDAKSFLAAQATTEVFVEEGDKVDSSTALFCFNGNDVFIPETGNIGGTVTKVAVKNDVDGTIGTIVNGRFVIDIHIEVEVQYRGECKGRGGFKVLFNNYDAAESVVKVDDVLWEDGFFGPGGIKNSKRFAAVSRIVRRGKVTETVSCSQTDYDINYAMYKADPFFTFDPINLTYTSTDPNGVIVEMDVLIESSPVQESMTDSAMTLYQMNLPAMLSKEGNEWIKAAVLSGSRRKLRNLKYLKLISAITPYAHKAAPIFELGVDQFDMEETLTPMEKLEEVAAAYKEGVNLVAGDTYVWFRPDVIRRMTALDGLQYGLTGIGSEAARLCEMMANPTLAAMINCVGLINKFKGSARHLSNAAQIGKVFGVYWGAGCKVVTNKKLADDEVAIEKNGYYDNLLASHFNAQPGTLEGRYAYMLRHPMIVGKVMKIVYNDHVSGFMFMVNERVWRAVTQGDTDGDTGNLFPIMSKKKALKIKADMEKKIPNMDLNQVVLGIPGHAETLGMYGEVVNTNKSVDDMMNRETTMPLWEREAEIEGSAEAATKYTGLAYRIMESGSILNAFGFGSLRGTLIGAWLYEHRGLAGATLKANARKFLDLWQKKPNSTIEAMEMFGALTAEFSKEIADYKAAPDSGEALTLMAGSELNFCLRKNGVPSEFKPLVTAIPYEDVYSLYALAWKLGRKKLSFALGDCVNVAKPEVAVAAKALGFDGSFMYQFVRMVACELAPVMNILGDAKLEAQKAGESDPVGAAMAGMMG